MIADHVVEGYLGSLLGNSEPGATLHHFLVSAGDPADVTALGFPKADKLHVTVYAIAPTQEVDAAGFVRQTIQAAIVQADKDKRVIYFAGLAMEIHTVRDDGNEVTENLTRRLLADRKLQEHPAAIEATQLYAACRAGRRWTGIHLLTGPTAGTIMGPTMHVGPLGDQEHGLHQRLVRFAVGL